MSSLTEPASRSLAPTSGSTGPTQALPEPSQQPCNGEVVAPPRKSPRRRKARQNRDTAAASQPTDSGQTRDIHQSTNSEHAKDTSQPTSEIQAIAGTGSQQPETDSAQAASSKDTYTSQPSSNIEAAPGTSSQPVPDKPSIVKSHPEVSLTQAVLTNGPEEQPWGLLANTQPEAGQTQAGTGSTPQAAEAEEITTAKSNKRRRRKKKKQQQQKQKGVVVQSPTDSSREQAQARAESDRSGDMSAAQTEPGNTQAGPILAGAADMSRVQNTDPGDGLVYIAADTSAESPNTDEDTKKAGQGEASSTHKLVNRSFNSDVAHGDVVLRRPRGKIRSAVLGNTGSVVSERSQSSSDVHTPFVPLRSSLGRGPERRSFTRVTPRMVKSQSHHGQLISERGSLDLSDRTFSDKFDNRRVLSQAELQVLRQSQVFRMLQGQCKHG